MNEELKNIKKMYGEKMMHLCRELFATILENCPSTLEQILKDSFNESRFLYDDIVDNNLIDDFKNYVYGIYDRICANSEEVISDVADPKTLMREAGYTLYECKTDEEIQAFRKYYQKDEELCTFKNGSRLVRCYVYFAVKDGADKLKRSDFVKPQRQDEYGTSVISIQFTRDGSHTLSIKNRYNHTVGNPDATYSNNLDNIIPGLTQSFADYYGMLQEKITNKSLDIPGYVKANDGKFYKYNYEINNIYYCPDNIVIDNFEVIRYPKEKYLIMDYFVIDLVNKKLILNNRHDIFIEMLSDIKNIEIVKDGENKVVSFYTNNGEKTIITLDNLSRIIKIVNNYVKRIENNFLWHNEVLQEISLDNVEEIGDSFLFNNEVMTKISLPNVRQIGDSFMCRSIVDDLRLPEVLMIGDRFMSSNHQILQVRLPKVKTIGKNFIKNNCYIEEINMPEVEIIGSCFLDENVNLCEINLPEVRVIHDNFCYSNFGITNINMPKVKSIGNMFMYCNNAVLELLLPEVERIGYNFMGCNRKLISVDLPKLEEVDSEIFSMNQNIERFYSPNLKNKKELKNKTVRKLVCKKNRFRWF